MVLQYRDIVAFHSDEQQSAAEKNFATYLPKELTFQSRFSGCWYYRLRNIVNNKKRYHEAAGEAWIVAQEDIVARVLGLSMVEESQNITDKKRKECSDSES